MVLFHQTAKKQGDTNMSCTDDTDEGTTTRKRNAATHKYATTRTHATNLRNNTHAQHTHRNNRNVRCVIFIIHLAFHYVGLTYMYCRTCTSGYCTIRYEYCFECKVKWCWFYIGGGTRAAMMGVGAIRRLYELGILRRATTISSVSGGSIVNGLYFWNFSYFLFYSVFFLSFIFFLFFLFLPI